MTFLPQTPFAHRKLILLLVVVVVAISLSMMIDHWKFFLSLLATHFATQHGRRWKLRWKKKEKKMFNHEYRCRRRAHVLLCVCLYIQEHFIWINKRKTARVQDVWLGSLLLFFFTSLVIRKKFPRKNREKKNLLEIVQANRTSISMFEAREKLFLTLLRNFFLNCSLKKPKLCIKSKRVFHAAKFNSNRFNAALFCIPVLWVR